MNTRNTSFQIVAGGGWRGTRVDRVKVKAWIALIIAMILAVVSISSIGTSLVHAFVPAVVSLMVAIVLFIREAPIEIESFTGRVGNDRSKLYGRSGWRSADNDRDDADKR